MKVTVGNTMVGMISDHPEKVDQRFSYVLAIPSQKAQIEQQGRCKSNAAIAFHPGESHIE